MVRRTGNDIRADILDYLRRHPNAKLLEVANNNRGVDSRTMTPDAAMYHIRKLMQSGLVDRVIGKDAYVYFLVPEAYQKKQMEEEAMESCEKGLPPEAPDFITVEQARKRVLLLAEAINIIRDNYLEADDTKFIEDILFREIHSLT